MATRKRSEIEKQIATLQAELDGADTDDEIFIMDESGHQVRLTGRRATTILQRYAKLWETNDDAPEESEEDDASDAEDGEDDDNSPDPDATPRQGYFGRKK